MTVRRRPFNMAARRRREIEAHAKAVGAADTDDFDRWLIAWVWNNPGSKDQIGAVVECAHRLGRRLTKRKAAEIIEAARTTRCCRSADNLSRWLRLTYKRRQALRITTIGAFDVVKRKRTEQRRIRDRLGAERRRRARGVEPQSEGLSWTKPWEALGICRRTWERRRAAVANSSPIDANSSPNVATPSTAVLLPADDELASAALTSASGPSDGVPAAAAVPPNGGDAGLRKKKDFRTDCCRRIEPAGRSGDWLSRRLTPEPDPAADNVIDFARLRS